MALSAEGGESGIPKVRGKHRRSCKARGNEHFIVDGNLAVELNI